MTWPDNTSQNTTERRTWLDAFCQDSSHLLGVHEWLVGVVPSGKSKLFSAKYLKLIAALGLCRLARFATKQFSAKCYMLGMHSPLSFCFEALTEPGRTVRISRHLQMWKTTGSVLFV